MRINIVKFLRGGRKVRDFQGPPNPRSNQSRNGYLYDRRRRLPRFLRRCLSIAAVLVAIFVVAASEKLDLRDFDGLITSTANASYDIEGRAEVIDGDTIRINGQRIRLHGIDAPESAQACTNKLGGRYNCGRDAARALDGETKGKYVSCMSRDVDRDGRFVAVCYAKGMNLSKWMVSQGWAVAYTRYSWAYLLAEVEARLAGRGIWSGDFTTPENWRRAN